MNGTSLLDTIQRSSFIFAGTVTAPTGSSLRVLPARPGLAVVLFERGFLINPMLGKLDGRPITVRLAQEGAGASAVRSGQRLLFFTTAWVHGEQIAVSELARLPADEKTEQEVTQILASLPEHHLRERIAAAVLIVRGVVSKIERAADVPEPISEHAARWMRAWIEVAEVLKGVLSPADIPGIAAKGTVALFFPGSGDRAYRDIPRPKHHQSGVFLLHPGRPPLPKEALVALDPADIQSDNQLATVRRLLGESAGSTPPR